jgi:putative Ca2+/H+ antiporter (TMEM165/GDT1 family)
MELIYPFLITFTLVFFSELGDKTQLLVLSFSTKNKTKNILLGVALGTFFSHGFAILFGSRIAYFSSNVFQFYLKIFTYVSFILFGLIGFWPTNQNSEDNTDSHKSNLLQILAHLKLNCIIIVAICILIGELGDKTFLASLGLGFEYPNSKFPLIVGSICGMVASNFIAICCGKLIGNHLKQEFIEFLSNTIFIIFGLLGFASMIF